MTARKMELQETLASELTERSIDNILQFRENVAEGLRNPTLEDKPRRLEIAQVTVRVTNSTPIISCRLGNNPLMCNLFEINKC